MDTKDKLGLTDVQPTSGQATSGKVRWHIGQARGQLPILGRAMRHYLTSLREEEMRLATLLHGHTAAVFHPDGQLAREAREAQSTLDSLIEAIKEEYP